MTAPCLKRITMEQHLSFLKARAAQSNFCECYGIVLMAIAGLLIREGITRLRIRYPDRCKCYNVCDENGVATAITEVGVSRNPDGTPFVTAWDEFGEEFPLGCDIDGQDNYSLSAPLVLLNAVASNVAEFSCRKLGCHDDTAGRVEILKIGDRVRWADPGINDFDPEERDEQRARIWTIVDCPSIDEYSDDAVVLITGDGGEAEVPVREIAIAA